MILYFSGSGNSRYVAEFIAKVTGDELVSINDHIKAKNKEPIKSDKPIVFVSPIYTGRLPRVVEKYIREVRFEGSKKAYFVTTCFQTSYNAQAYVKKLCREKEFTLAGFDAVIMPQCYIVMYQPPSKSEADKIISDAIPQINKTAEDIRRGKAFMQEAKGGKIMSAAINPIFYSLFVSAKGFYATEACIRCGSCVKRCSLNNVTMKNGKPKWGEECTHCMACIGGCPEEAIEFKNKTQGKPRCYNTNAVE